MTFPDYARLAPCARLLLLALAAILPLLLAAPATGQTAPPPEAPPPEAATTVAPADLEALLATLTDEAEREKLVRQLRTLIEAQRAMPPEARPFGARLLDDLSGQAARLGSQLADAADHAVDLPDAWEWARAQLSEPARRDRWIDILVKISLTLAAGLLAETLARRLLARARHAVEARATDRALARFALLLLRTVLDMLPILAFAAAAYAILPLLDPRGTVRIATLAFVNANVLARLAAALARMVLAPQTPRLRFLSLSDEAAAYLYRQTVSLTAVAIYGYFLVRLLYLLGASASAYSLLLKLLGIVVAGMLIALILRNRAPVAAWIRGEAAGEGAPAGGWRMMRARLGDIWHAVAVAYVIALCGIWILQVDDGFAWLARATLLTALILVGARMICVLLHQALQRGFAIGAETRRSFPTLQRHADRYLPIIESVLRWLVWLVAAVLILAVWGADLSRWAGGAVMGAALRIGVVLLVAVLVWELITAGLARWLRSPGIEGQTEPSARARTLLPLLERFAFIVLAAIVALMAMSEIGINIGPLLAGAGIVGIAVGFGAQSLVKDVITGLFILMEDQFSVGDVVNVGGKGGLVEGISMRTIRLRDYDGTVFTVPFSEVTSTANLTKGFSYYVFNVAVSYREDPDQVIAVLKELGQELMADPVLGPVILEPLDVAGVDKLGDSAVIVKCRFKTKPIQQWNVGREFNKRMKKRFDERDIHVPSPHHTVWFGTHKDGSSPPLRIALDDQARTIAQAKAIGDGTGGEAPAPG